MPIKSPFMHCTAPWATKLNSKSVIVTYLTSLSLQVAMDIFGFWLFQSASAGCVPLCLLSSAFLVYFTVLIYMVHLLMTSGDYM